MSMAKFFLVAIQIYALLVTTIFAESTQIYPNTMDGVFHSINMSRLKHVANELKKYQAIPTQYMAELNNEKTKTGKRITELTIKLKEDIKKVKVDMVNDELLISYKKLILRISEIGFNNVIVVNNQELAWDPETDNLDELQNKLSLILGNKNTSWHSIIIPSAQAQVSEILGGVVVLSLYMFGLYKCSRRGDLVEYDKNLIQSATEALRKATSACHSDLDTQVTTDESNTETTNFIKFTTLYISKVGRSCEKSKEGKALSCKLSPIQHTTPEIKKLIKEACEYQDELNNCLDRYHDRKMKNVVDNSRANINEIDQKSHYYELFQMINSGKVSPK